MLGATAFGFGRGAGAPAGHVLFGVDNLRLRSGFFSGALGVAVGCGCHARGGGGPRGGVGPAALLDLRTNFLWEVSPAASGAFAAERELAAAFFRLFLVL